MKSSPELFYKYCPTCLLQRKVIYDVQKLASELRSVQAYLENNTVIFDADKGKDIGDTLVDTANAIQAVINRKINENQH